MDNKRIWVKSQKGILKQRDILQLEYWNFSKQRDDELYSAPFSFENTELLFKLIDYFEEKHYLVKKSSIVENVISEYCQEKSEFSNFLVSASNFKNGDFSNSEYQDALSFLTQNIKRELRDHQKKAFFHLQKIRNGANFSVPGSGKTTVVLSYYEFLKKNDIANRLLVIGPPSCFGPWKEEFLEVFGRKPNTKILAGGNVNQRKQAYYELNTKSELYLTSFQTVLNDQDDIVEFLKVKSNKVFVVIDEAHYIKRINGNWANAVLRLSEYAISRCVLTGTPIPQGYSDLYNIFDFLWPKRNLLSQEDKIRIEQFEKEKDFTSASKILEPKIGPLFYRVRKSELGLKPQNFHPPYLINMNLYERKLYEAIETKIRNYSQDDYIKNVDFILSVLKGRMMRLRQALSDTSLLKTAIEGYEENLLDNADLLSIVLNYRNLETPAKIEYLLQMIDDFSSKGQKIVIWGHFIDTIKFIENKIRDRGYYCKKIIGETPVERVALDEAETREKIRNEFVSNRSGLNILLANPAACAESISLHKTCHHAIYYDLSYNGAQYLQSLDRIHRVGGSEDHEAHYHFLQYNDTVEYKILENQKAKAQKMSQIVDGNYAIYDMNMSEIDDIDITLYKDIFSSSD